MKCFALALLVAVASAQQFASCDLIPQTGITTGGYGTVACIKGQIGSANANAFSCQAWFDGLASPVVAAHLHVGNSISAGGAPTFNFTTAVLWATTPGVIQDHWTSSSKAFLQQGAVTFDSQVTDCMAGNCYFNVHTIAHAGGEVACVLAATTNAVTHTSNFGPESAGTSATATGTLSYTTAFGVTTQQDAVFGYTATFSGLSSSLYQVHVHDSACTDNSCSGSPFIFVDFAGGDGITSGSITGVNIRTSAYHGLTTSGLSAAYSPGLWLNITGVNSASQWQSELNAGKTYFNLHTQNNHGGEIRAQLKSGVSALAPSALVLAVCAFFAFKQ